MESDEKFITMKLFKNGNRFVAEIRNSAKKKPSVIGNVLKTTKKDKELHGVGIKSIEAAVKRCNGCLDWSYDEKQRIFEANVVLIVPSQKSKDEKEENCQSKENMEYSTN